MFRALEACPDLGKCFQKTIDRNDHNNRGLTEYGAVDCTSPSDPQCWKYGSRWTFDPSNAIYDKAWLFALPDSHPLRPWFNKTTRGNIFEAILGDRNKHYKEKGEDLASDLHDTLSTFVLSVHRFCHYTRSGDDTRRTWADYILRLRVGNPRE